MMKHLKTALLSALLFVTGVSYLPYLWCSRGANRWYTGDRKLQEQLARGVEQWLDSDLSRQSYRTGSSQFDGEWLFGTYLMAGFGYGQTAIQHPALRDRHVQLMDRCIDRILSENVRAFDREMWGNDPIDTLDEPDAHAAYLGYLNLLLGLHRMLAPDSAHTELHDRISTALKRRVRRSPILLIESYPDEVYPVDNCAVIASIAMHNRSIGADRGALVAEWVKEFRKRYVDPDSGIVIQAVSSWDGSAIDEPRGSGTALGLYFLSFADMHLSRDLYDATRVQLAKTVFGFGGVREYPTTSGGGYGDIDSGPVIFGFGLSPTGFLLGGSRLHEDQEYFRRLYATAYAWGAPLIKDDRLNFVAGTSLGDAILFAMLTATPLAEKTDA